MRSFSRGLFYFFVLVLIFNSSLSAQEKKVEFIELNTLKLSVGQLPVNEVRVAVERQIAAKTSVEISPAFVFKNDIWFKNGFADEFFLSKGFGLDASIRRYFDKKRYIFQPFFRSYLSFGLSWKHTAYDSLWFVFLGGDPTEDECTLASKTFNYLGGRVLFGLQKREGRFVIDLYGGMGLRMMIRNFHYHARNLNGTGCEIIPGTTEFVFPNQEGVSIDYSPTLHAGIKLGIRWGKKRSSKKENPGTEGTGGN